MTLSIDVERDADVDQEVAELVALCEAEIARQKAATKLYKEFAWLACTLRDHPTDRGIRDLVRLRADLIAAGFPVPFDRGATS